MIGRRPSSEEHEVFRGGKHCAPRDRDIKGQISMEEHKCEHNDISYPKGLKWTKQRKCVYQVSGGSDRAPQRRTDLQSY